MHRAPIENSFLNQKQIKHELEQEGRGYLLIASKVPAKQDSCPLEILDEVLNYFTDAFLKNLPHGLPPILGIEH